MGVNKGHAPLRARLERELHWQIPDPLWQLHEASGLVADAELYGAADEDKLREQLTGAHLWSHGGARQSQRQRAPIERLLEEGRQRTEAVTRLAAELASTDPAVWAYRAEVLHHPLPLTEGEAVTLLASPFAARWPASWFSQVPFPVVGHKVSGESRKAKVTEYHVEWDGGAGTFDVPAVMARLPHLVYTLADGRLSSVDVLEDSVLGKLADMAEELGRSYPWHPSLAAAFVLEGAPPLATPLTTRLATRLTTGRPPRARITLEVDAWVPEKVVAHAYRAVQREVLAGHNRPVSARSLQLVNYVGERRTADPGLTWPALLEGWNATHPTQAFDTYRHLRRAHERAKRSLLYPRYHFSKEA